MADLGGWSRRKAYRLTRSAGHLASPQLVYAMQAALREIHCQERQLIYGVNEK